MFSDYYPSTIIIHDLYGLLPSELTVTVESMFATGNERKLRLGGGARDYNHAAARRSKVCPLLLENFYAVGLFLGLFIYFFLRKTCYCSDENIFAPLVHTALDGLGID